MADQVDIRLFGTFEVRVDSRRITEPEWPRRRPMELVQLLALSPGRSVVRDRVVDALWPHLDADAGAANLRKAAHHARQILGDSHSIVLRSGQVHLFPDAVVTTDLERFLRAASDALLEGSAAERIDAADLATGELLPGALYEDWAAEERRKVRSTLLSLLRTARAWERVVELEPTDETAYQELMRAAITSGARAEAVRRFGEVRDTLATELGVRPSTGTLALYDEAVGGLLSSSTDLLGRDLELSAIHAALHDQPGRAPGIVTVHGPPGIGKSAFCRRAAELLAEQDRAVFWTDTAGRDQPFGPLIEIVEEALLDPRDLMSDVAAHARSVLAALTQVARSARPVDGPLTRHQVLGAISQVLRAAAGGRPFVLVLDDAQEADEATIDVLLHMATSLRDATVVLAYRSAELRDEVRAGLARLSRCGRLLEVELGPLEGGAPSELVRRSASTPLHEEAIASIVDRADGNPFAITELAANAAQDGANLPQSVAEAITARLVGVDEVVADVLRHLALAPDELDTMTILALTGRETGEAFALLDRALTAGVLVVVDGRYRFRHDLVRDALRAQLAPHQQVRFHRDAARRLMTARAPAAVVAHHWLEAGEPGEATPWCIEAAQAAVQVGAFRDARRHLAPVLAFDPVHPDALRLDAECLDMLGDPGALVAYDAAIAVAGDDVADDLVIARALAQIKQGDPAGGLAAIEGATPRSPMGRLNEALTYAGAAALGATDPAVGTLKADQVRRVALEAGDRAGIVIAAWAHAAAAHARGDLHDSVLNDLRETKDIPHLAVRVFDGHLCMTQRFLYGSRPYDEVITFADELTKEARRLGALRGEAFGVTLMAEAHFLSGRLEEAHGGFEHGLGLHRETGGTTGEAHALQRLAELEHAAGRSADAKAVIDEALALARISDIGFHLLDRIYGSRITVCDDPAEALAAVEEAEAAVRGPLETCPGCRIHMAVPAAIASARAGDLDRAHDYAAAADYLAHVVMRLPAWYAAYDEVLANVARAEGDHDAARALFESATEKYAATGQPVDAARCRIHA